MNLISDFLSRLVRLVIKVLFLLITLGVVLALLAMGLVFALIAILRALLTGRRPAVATHFTRFRQAARPFGAQGWGQQTPHPPPNQEDVVDVQAREVPVSLGNNKKSDQVP